MLPTKDVGDGVGASMRANELDGSKVLGIDPGSRYLGWGVVLQDGRRRIHIASGVIAPEGASLAARLSHLARALDTILEEHRPAMLSLETMFLGRNPRSAVVLAHARGVAMCRAAVFGLEVHEYTPTQIKQAITGGGGASKEQVQAMVRLLLRLDAGPLSLDRSDALAAALCHIQAAPWSNAAKASAAIQRAGRKR